MKFMFTGKEIKEILLSALVLSVSFAIAFTGIGNALGNPSALPLIVLYSFIAVGIAFLAHELIGHKLIAQRFGMHAEYRMWKFGLGLALVSSLGGFIFAAPGAVYVASRVDLWGRSPKISARQMGLVSIAGPLINGVLVGLFMMINFFWPSLFFDRAILINVWLGLFNMIPIPPLDGSKVLAWDKRIWAATFALFAILLFFRV